MRTTESLTEMYNVLVLCNSPEESDRIGSMLSNSGLPCEWLSVSNLNEFENSLKEKRQSKSSLEFSTEGSPLSSSAYDFAPNWNVIIYHTEHTDIPLNTLLQSLKTEQQDIPIISLIDPSKRDTCIIDHLRKGAANTVVLDDDMHLVLSIKKEAKHQAERLKSGWIEKSIEGQNQKINSLIENSRDGIAFIEDGLIVYCNKTFAESLGYPKDEVECALSLNDIFSKEFHFLTTKLNKVSSGEDLPFSSPQPLTYIDSEGNSLEILSSISKAQYENSPCIQLCMLHSNAQLVTAPNTTGGSTDLEGIINRNIEKINERVSELLKSAHASHTTHAVALISIANALQVVTENIGLISQPEVMFDLHKQLSPLVPESESLDWLDHQHLLWTSPNTDTETINVRAQEIFEQADQFFLQSKEKTIRVKLIIGIGLITEYIENPLEAVEFARRAQRNLMTQDKGFEGGFSIYEPQKLEQLTAENDISHMLKSALDKNKFRLMFQPIISLRGTEMEQYEVFLRMVDKENKEISPGLFLDKAKELNLLGRIDRFVILEAVKRLASQRHNGQQPKLIINISEHSILDNNMASWIKTALSAADLPPSEVIFQVSEAIASSFLKQTKYFVEEMHQRHILTSITNFGRSSHPFNLLDHINFDYVKIDGSIMNEFQKSPSSTRIIDMIKLLIQNKKSCVVPFVENASSLSHLWQAGAHYIQGHYLQKPHWEMNYDFQINT